MNVSRMVDTLRERAPHLVAIGGSAGAIEALERILPPLPPTFPAVVVVVIHVAPGRYSGLAPIFDHKCRLSVCEVEDKRPMTCGIYFAPPDYHLLVERTGTFALSTEEAVHFSRPAIDVFFDSVADAYLGDAMGILLSGASVDGAAGLNRIRSAGGLTWVQDPAVAAVQTMPLAALNLAPHDRFTPEEMGAALAAWGSPS